MMKVDILYIITTRLLLVYDLGAMQLSALRDGMYEISNFPQLGWSYSLWSSGGMHLAIGEPKRTVDLNYFKFL